MTIRLQCFFNESMVPCCTLPNKIPALVEQELVIVVSPRLIPFKSKGSRRSRVPRRALSC